MMWMLWMALAWAGDWPDWLGPNRDARSPEDISRGFGSASVLWRSGVGLGYAGSVVQHGTVWTTGTDERGDWLYALNATDGALKWRHRLDRPYQDSMGFEGTRATPVLAGDVVVALSGEGTLVVVKRDTGARVWAVDLVKTYGGVRPQWGYSGTPLVQDGVIYVAAGGAGGHALLALRLTDGSLIWHSGDDGAAYSSPVMATLAGTTQVVAFVSGGAVGLEPATGRELWRFPWETSYDVNAATPLLLGDDRLFIASGYGSGGVALRVTQSEGTFRAEQLWRSKRMKNRMATSVLYKGTLYGFNESRLTALDASNGEELWGQDGFGRGTVLGAGDDVIVLGENCELALIRTDRKAFRRIGNLRHDVSAEPCWTVPSLSDGVLVLRDARELVALRVGSPAAKP